MAWIIDDISQVLAVADIKGILDKYFHEHKGKDPIVHFYETFLDKYSPKIREERGVYYTPEPVVSFIVRSIHNILKNNFIESIINLHPANNIERFFIKYMDCYIKYRGNNP